MMAVLPAGDLEVQEHLLKIVRSDIHILQLAAHIDHVLKAESAVEETFWSLQPGMISFPNQVVKEKVVVTRSK